MKKLVTLLLAVAVVGGAVAVPALAATKTVTVGDNYFVSKTKHTVTVKKGTTVKWVWKGKHAHGIKVTKGPVKFSSKVQTKGSFSKKLTKVGTYTIICAVHGPSMKMTLKVTK